MINRTLIRLKIVQLIYSFYQNGGKDIKTAEKELMFSLSKAYDLYNYLLLLLVELTKYESEQIEQQEELNKIAHKEEAVSHRFVNNRFVKQLADRLGFQLACVAVLCKRLPVLRYNRSNNIMLLLRGDFRIALCLVADLVQLAFGGLCHFQRGLLGFIVYHWLLSPVRSVQACVAQFSPSIRLLSADSAACSLPGIVCSFPLGLRALPVT